MVKAALVIHYVGDLNACCARIRANGGTVERIIEPRNGIPSRLGLIWDPAGNGFQFDQNVD